MGRSPEVRKSAGRWPPGLCLPARLPKAAGRVLRVLCHPALWKARGWVRSFRSSTGWTLRPGRPKSSFPPYRRGKTRKNDERSVAPGRQSGEHVVWKIVLCMNGHRKLNAETIDPASLLPPRSLPWSLAHRDSCGFAVTSGADPRVRADEPLHRQIDGLIRLGAKGKAFSPLADDAEFLRRAYLDFAGRIPSADEVRQFFGDKMPARRTELIDRLLAGPKLSDADAGSLQRPAHGTAGRASAVDQYARHGFEQNKPGPVCP